MAISGHPHATDIPDPNDRTPNDPAVLVSSKHVKAYQRHQDQLRLVDPAQQAHEYAVSARALGWKATILGTSVLLEANVSLEVPKP